MLAEKIREHDARVWLVNTGWSGGPYGVGEHFSLKYTRAIVDAIQAGQLDDALVQRDVRFGFDVLTACPGVPAEPMVPKQVWADALAYEAQANHLAEFFKANFVQFEEGTVEAVKQAGPA